MNRILYYHPQSNFSRKIRILLAEKKVAYQLQEINLRDKPASFLALSPLGKVPVFVDEDGTIIWDSSLIGEYIEEKYPQPAFYPNSFQERLSCRKWEELADTLGDNIIQLWLINLTNNVNPNFFRTRLETSINRLIPIFEQQLTQTEYLLGGNSWSIADISALCSFGYYDLRLNEDWKLTYPHLKNWFEKLHEIESVKSTIPPKMF